MGKNCKIRQNTSIQHPASTERSIERISLLLASFCLALSSGYLSGQLIPDYQSPITLQRDTRPLVPTVHIQGVRNGLLHGSIKGSARVIIGNEIFTQSGVFAMDAGPMLTNEVSVVIPPDVEFVASKRGKKYYPVFSAGGERISPKNRIYFRTSQEAETAGFSY